MSSAEGGLLSRITHRHAVDKPGILCNAFGFSVIRQRGNYVVLKRITPHETVGIVVPLHEELKSGTLKGVLVLAKVDEKEFEKYL